MPEEVSQEESGMEEEDAGLACIAILGGGLLGERAVLIGANVPRRCAIGSHTRTGGGASKVDAIGLVYVRSTM